MSMNSWSTSRGVRIRHVLFLALVVCSAAAWNTGWGAETHWSFRPIERPSVPVLDDSAANPIDAFIQARLQEKGLEASPEADRRTLVRRLHLVALGLPPSVDEIEAFVNDGRADAWARLVDGVLSSPRYGERWTQHWIDIVRYAESDGFEGNPLRKDAWHFRDYLIESFNTDKPYDRFVQEQIAGDAMHAGVATGYLVAGGYDNVKSGDIVLTLTQRQDELADMINTTGTAFLGLTLGCARCHDHKFDPVTQKDYYSIQAVFAGVRHGRRRVSPTDYVRERIRELDAGISRFWKELGDYLPASEPGTYVFLDEGSVWSGRGVVHYQTAEDMAYSNPPEDNAPEDSATVHVPADLSSGRYCRWRADGNEPVIAYRPLVRGRHELLLSWAASKTHADGPARYVLDRDGSAQTTEDQKVLLTVDQVELADGTRAAGDDVVWSGLRTAGVHDLEPESAVLLYAAVPGARVTSDVLVCRSAPHGDQSTTRVRRRLNTRRNVEVFEPVKAQSVRLTLLDCNDGDDSVVIDELEVFSGDRNVALASNGGVPSSTEPPSNSDFHKTEFINDGRYGNDFSWSSWGVKTGWVQVDFPEPQTIERVEWGRSRRFQSHRDRVPTRYRVEVALENGPWKLVANSRNRLPYFGSPRQPELDPNQLPGVARKQWDELLVAQKSEKAIRDGLSYVGKFENPAPTHVLNRGDPMQPLDEVPPGAITSLRSPLLAPNTPEQQRRVELARWITRDDNPLAARVMVNRIWQHVFGIGIVGTPSDFGSAGTPPTHPRLLDWLATELRRSGWSLKHVHRTMLTSRTFRQDSRPREKALAMDGDSRFLWRFPPRRLEGEAIRDSILTATGVIDYGMGGPGFSGHDVQIKVDIDFLPKEVYGPEDFRRMIYMTRIRQEAEPVFGLFDCPDNTQVAASRGRSTTPLQAFNLANSSFTVQQSKLMAERLERSRSNPRDGAEYAYWLAFGRPAESEEIDAAVEFADQYGLWMLCRALFNANEFLLIP
jgi:hypothetical protein